MRTQSGLMLASVIGWVACSPTRMDESSGNRPPSSQDLTFFCSHPGCEPDGGSCLDEHGNLVLTGACLTDHGRAIWYLSRLSDRYQVGCQSDSDCVVVEGSVRCQYVCPVAVLRTNAAEYLNARDEFGAGVCPRVPSSCGCHGDCPAPTGAACRCNHCFVQFAGLSLPSCDGGS
jgi:hypothetical protein